MENTALDVRDDKQLVAAEENMSMVVTKDYLGKLSQYDILPMDTSLQNIDICDRTRLYKLNKLVYQRDESMVDKMSTSLYTAFTIGASVVSFSICDIVSTRRSF